MLEIRILDTAQRFLSDLDRKSARQVANRIKQLAHDPYPPRSKLLEGYAPLRRLASGDYRIIFFVDGNVLKIPLIDKRGDDKVYRRLKRLFG